MRKKSMHVVLMASVLVFSSIAGCLGNVDDDQEERIVIVSTYHIEQIVSAIVGDTVNVEILAPSNVPVHDYQPSPDELLQLQDADIFFYHGLGLEPWAEATLEGLGDDAPDHFETHAVADGSQVLLYNEMMIDTLCSDLSSLGTQDIHILHETMYFMDELHSDNAAYNMGMPGDHDDHDHDDDDDHGDDDHDEHDHDGHDHDEDREDHDGHDHDEDREDHDGHDHDEDREDHDGHDHGDHDGHDHGNLEKMEAEETYDGNADCPADTTISVYELEAGEYVLEFESGEVETFKIAIAAMGGAHHHHHDHGEEEGEEGESEDAHGVCYDITSHVTHDEYTSEDACEDAGYMWVEEEHEMSGEEMLEMGDTNNDSMLDATEFLALMEMFEDEDGSDEDEHDHDDDNHDAHDHGHDEGHDEDGMSHEMEEAMWNLMFSTADMNADNMLDENELNELIRALEGDYFDNPSVNGEVFMAFSDADEDGVLSLEEFESLMEMDSEEDDHDDHWEPNTCHDEDTHETHNEYTNKEDCEAAGHMWMEEDDHDDDDHDEHDHDGHDEIERMFNMTDANGDGSIDSEEFHGFMKMMGDDDREEGVAFIGFHVEEEGDYGFALPEGVKLHILSMGGHEGHDHGSHDDHGDEDGDDHDDHGDEDGDDHDDHGDEDALSADPHSWLDPLAYKAQVALVLAELKKEFPDLEDTFEENAMAFMASLDKLHDDYDAAFGTNGTCTNRTVAANHNAYSYIAYRYNLEFVTVHGLDPEGEPSAEDILEVVERIEEDEINVLFVEEYTDETAVNSIVDQTDGVDVEILYTMELPPKDSNDDYLSLMEKNLNSLKAGLGC
jgi:ABC-type Zn uptake system ZnuABC Zn-binding protein ZnuA